MESRSALRFQAGSMTAPSKPSSETTTGTWAVSPVDVATHYSILARRPIIAWR